VSIPRYCTCGHPSYDHQDRAECRVIDCDCAVYTRSVTPIDVPDDVPNRCQHGNWSANECVTCQRQTVARLRASLDAAEARISDLKLALGDDVGWFDRAMKAEARADAAERVV
jgi:hypothetical protein